MGQGWYYHPHNDPKCPSYQSMVKKFTKEGRSCEKFIKEVEARMKLPIWNFPDLVETY